MCAGSTDFIMINPHSRYSRFVAETRQLGRLTGPLVLSQVVFSCMGLMDTVMAGRAGAFEQAVVGLGVGLWIPVFITLMGIVQAVSPTVAHHFGACDMRGIVEDTREGLWLAIFCSLVPFMLMPFVGSMLVWAQIDPLLAEKTTFFLWGILMGLPAALLFRTLGFYSASINHPQPLMAIGLLGLATNGAFNWLLIYGHWGFPKLGGAGCGWATGIGMWVGLFAMIAYTAIGRVYEKAFLWHGWSWPRWSRQKKLLRLGLPMGGSNLAEVSAFAGIALLVGRFGAIPIAAHQIGMNFASIIFMFPMGLSAAISIRVGQSLGTKDPHSARFIAWSGIVIGIMMAIVMVPTILLGRNSIAVFYTPDAAVQQVAATLLLLAALWQFADVVQVCAVGALRGYKVNFLPMCLVVFAYWVVGIPLGAWIGYRGLFGVEPLGIYGFWMGLVIGLFIVAGGFVTLLRWVANVRVNEAVTFACTGLNDEGGKHKG